MREKILTFIIKNDKFLILKGHDKDSQFHESFWYVVTGGVEECDISIEDAVRREVEEECNIIVDNIQFLNWTFIYNSLGKMCVERAFVSSYKSGDVKLNEESVKYKWCTMEEVLDMIKWYGSKEKLRYVLQSILNRQIPFNKENVERF